MKLTLLKKSYQKKPSLYFKINMEMNFHRQTLHRLFESLPNASVKRAKLFASLQYILPFFIKNENPFITKSS